MTEAWGNDELWVDLVIAGVICVLGEFAAHSDWFSFGSTLNKSKPVFYANETQTIAATLGFLIAGAALIAASPNISRLRDSSFLAFGTLARSFRDSIYVSIVAIAYCFAAPLFDTSLDNAAWLVVAIALFALNLLRIYRAARRLYLSMLI